MITDTQTLRDAGVQNNSYKMILGSKSFSPSKSPTAPLSVPFVPLSTNIALNLTLAYKSVYSPEDVNRINTIAQTVGEISTVIGMWNLR